MPEPARGGQRYLPGLDGLRALAVLAVIAYHLQLGWAPGGMLGVAVFFTLSGYLITDLLLQRWASTGSLQLADFWRRRARRLLPALFLMLAVVTVWVSLADPGQLAEMRGGVAAAAGYVSNWWLIAQHSSYFARFGPPMPLGHLWSLAVEEQFYLIWPWLLWLGLKWPAGRRSPWLLATATLALAGASAAAMALLYHPGYDPTRVYDGTDTRAFGVLIGAALAFVWPTSRPRAGTRAVNRRVLDAAGLAGLAVIACLIWRMGEYSPALYPGGMILVSLATATVIWAVASPVSRIGPMLGWRPLRWLGVRSYGIYLWHYPIIVLTTPANGQESLVRGAAQVAASIGAAALSWRFVEDPIRHGALGRWWARLTAGGWRAAPRQAWVAAGAAAGTVALISVALAGAVQPVLARPVTFNPYVTGSSRLVGSATGQGPAERPASGGAGTPAPAGAAGAAASPSRLHTSCRAVVHIGDSTSEGMISADYLPNPAQRLAAQYARVGVRMVRPEISGARSIVETYDGYPNAWTVAQQLIRHGYHGCWVLALGTNDAADVAVGSPTSMATRIRWMMSVTRGQPVMWVNVKSLLASGPYAETNMLRWNRALLQACPRYPNMRVYDWAEAAKPGWFISDGIHYTSAGYAARAHLIASALADAFPQSQPPQPGLAPLHAAQRPAGEQERPGCLVH
jgi:peptidoglycan/LPS O-acetylase OafA/YrhL/lysophospholipase L1-like esterase